MSEPNEVRVCIAEYNNIDIKNFWFSPFIIIIILF